MGLTMALDDGRIACAESVEAFLAAIQAMDHPRLDVTARIAA